MAANSSLLRSISLKRKLDEQISEYESFAKSLDKHLETMSASNEPIDGGRGERGDALYLPLHDYGAYSQADFVRDESSMDHADANGSLTSLEVREAGRVEALLKSQLLRRLRSAVQASVTEQRTLEEELIPGVIRKMARASEGYQRVAESRSEEKRRRTEKG